MKAEFIAYPKTTYFSKESAKAVDVEFKFILKTIESSESIEHFMKMFNDVNETFSYIEVEEHEKHVDIFTEDKNLYRSILLTLTN